MCCDQTAEDVSGTTPMCVCGERQTAIKWTIIFRADRQGTSESLGGDAVTWKEASLPPLIPIGPPSLRPISPAAEANARRSRSELGNRWELNAKFRYKQLDMLGSMAESPSEAWSIFHQCSGNGRPAAALRDRS